MVEAVEHYLAEGSAQAVLGFIDALAQAYRPTGAIRRPTRRAAPTNSTFRDFASGR